MQNSGYTRVADRGGIKWRITSGQPGNPCSFVDIEFVMSSRICLVLIMIAFIVGCGRDEASPPLTKKTPSPVQATETQEKSLPMADGWPFEDAHNTAVITLTRIMDGSQPILYVVHDEEGDWQFLDGGDVSEEDAATVSLKNVSELDPSVKSLADLPIGWAAERTAVDQDWQRYQR